ncbi:LPS-assembly lipoprotein LptE [Aliidiomarina celeris]|uniref:LPS-assembly lipoprotein LptE n=1 Tax=Aliidiomarina celeris TaxID=2249428 RepID=UPI000DE89522|nr:LPS assembly lipoprotein LptE [Aliidiomarina celeris]
MHISRWVKYIVVLQCLFTLQACGFHFRGDYQVPEHLTQVSVNASLHNQVASILQDALHLRSVEVVPQNRGIPHIEIGEDQLDRRILSLLPSGQVAEYELIYTLPVAFVNEQGERTTQRIQLTRDYQDDPNFALAKTRELELIVSEMRDTAVQRLLILMNQYLRE